ncbi:MAG: choice-of-anchor B family protein [Flavobacteriaceae bacterium]
MNKKLLLGLTLLLPQLFLSQTPCSGGMAGSYPCDGITLQSYISAATMGAAEGQDSWGWTDPLTNKEYALVGLDNGTAFVDITNPTSPIYLGRLNTHTGSSLWRDVKVYNDYVNDTYHAYIVSDGNGNHGMQIFDLTRLRSVVSPPVNFTEDGWKTWGTSGTNRGRAHNIIIQEETGHAFVVGVSPYISGGIVVFDLTTDPENPSIVGTYSTAGYCHDAQVLIYDGPDPDYQGDEIMVGTFSGSDFVRVLKVNTNPSTGAVTFTQISSLDYSNKYYTHQGWFTEDRKFFITGDEVDEENVGFNTRTLVFDMEDLDSPSLHYTYFGATPAIDHNGYVRGNRFYLANYAAGMRILKIDGLYDPTPSMTEINYFDTFPASNSASFNATWNVYPFFESGNLIATGFGDENVNGDGGLFILRDPNYDNVAPTAVCQNITVTLDKTLGTASINALDVDGGSTDNFGITQRSITGQTTFTCADVGNTFNVTLTVKDDYGNTSSCVATVTVAAETTAHLGAGVWSNGIPDVGSNAKISSDYDTASFGSIDACTCEIDATKTLTVNADDYIKIEKNITVNGTLNVAHQGNVVQTNPTASVIKNGTINVNVTSPILRKRDFMVMGSPMTSEDRNGVWDSAFLVLNFIPQNFLPHPDVPAGGTNFADDNGDFNSIYTGTINPGEGYVVRPQSGYNDPSVPPSGRTFDFVYELGTLNNGDISYTNYNNGPTANPNGTPNIIANPYASAIDANTFISANPGIGALYFWEHLTPPGNPLPVSNLRFDMDDISIYNGVMGIPAANDTGGTTAPNGIIATGQGFGVRTTGTPGSTGTITFNNTMRLTSGNTTLRDQESTTEKLILEVREDTHGYGSFAGIAFHDNGTNGYDEEMDTNRLATVVSLYSLLQDEGTEELGIQTIGKFESGTKIPFGFNSQIDENLEYEISISDIKGENLESAEVFIFDNFENKTVNLKDQPYTFKSGMGTFKNRFTIKFMGEEILGPGESALDLISIFPNPANKNITVYSPSSHLLTLEVYDLLGKRISQKIDGERNSYQLDLSNLKDGIYFIKIDTEIGSVTKKIIKRH